MLDTLTCVLHLDKCITELAHSYPAWIWLVLFVVIFSETGLIVLPFLPGDSLLFISGTIAATGAYSVYGMSVLLVIAAILGDAVNYHIGKKMGHSMIQPHSRWQRWIKPKYIQETEAFFEKHGAMAVILGRFAPIIRTFVPFLAGMGHMRYSTFLRYNIIGAILWINIFIYAGYFLGSIPVVQHNLKWILLSIIIISLVPFSLQLLSAIKNKENKTTS